MSQEYVKRCERINDLSGVLSPKAKEVIINRAENPSSIQPDDYKDEPQIVIEGHLGDGVINYLKDHKELVVAGGLAAATIATALAVRKITKRHR